MYILIVLCTYNIILCMYLAYLLLITHQSNQAVQVVPLYNSKTPEVLVC